MPALAGTPDNPERDALLKLLQETSNVPEAAKRLGVHFTTLYRRLRKYGIDPKKTNLGM